MATDIHELAILFDASGLRVSDVSFKEGGAVVGSGAVLEVLQATKHTGYMYMYMDMWLSIYLSFSLSLYIYICTPYLYTWMDMVAKMLSFLLQPNVCHSVLKVDPEGLSSQARPPKNRVPEASTVM